MSLLTTQLRWQICQTIQAFTNASSNDADAATLGVIRLIEQYFDIDPITGQKRRRDNDHN